MWQTHVLRIAASHRECVRALFSNLSREDEKNSIARPRTENTMGQRGMPRKHVGEQFVAQRAFTVMLCEQCLQLLAARVRRAVVREEKILLDKYISEGLPYNDQKTIRNLYKGGPFHVREIGIHLGLDSTS